MEGGRERRGERNYMRDREPRSKDVRMDVIRRGKNQNKEENGRKGRYFW